MLSEGQILGGKWKIKSLVGEGACAKVYSVEHIDNNKKYDYPLVAKCIEYGKGFSKSALKEQEKISSTLNRERIVLAPGQFLTQFKYRPRIPGLDFYGKDETLGVVYLVLEQLNRNLKELSETISSSVFSIGSIGLQLLDGLQWLHMNGWLFTDIKPENFMFRENDNIVFIDYGLMERYAVHSKFGVKDKSSCGYNGTPAYISLSIHNGNKPCPFDEIESMCYVLLSLTCQGKLPWVDAKSDSECKHMKESFDYQSFASECHCEEVAEILHMCRLRANTESPNYELIKSILVRFQNKPIASTNSRKRKPEVKLKKSDAPSTASAPSTIGLNEKVTESKGIKKILAPHCDIIASPKKTSKELKLVASIKGNVSSILEPSILSTHTSTSKTSRANNKKSSLLDPVVQKPNSAMSLVPLSVEISPLEEEPNTRPLLSSEPVIRNEGRKSKQTLNQENEQPQISSQSASFVVTKGIHMGESFSLGVDDLNISKQNGELDKAKRSRKKKYTLDIGRDMAASISLHKDDSVSEKHAKVTWDITSDGRLAVRIKDTKSTNGTKINGARIDSQSWNEVKTGDLVTIGESTFMLKENI